MKVAFIHPDLGIGGAERLVIDAAVALKSQGHQVTMYTAHHDRGHCFEETVDGTLEVEVYGDWLPKNIFGFMYALCAYIRMIYLAFIMCLFSEFDAVFCDQVAAAVVVFKLMRSAKILFYCHYPDMLLTARQSTAKKIYRYPLDTLEEYATGKADAIMVNSEFTASVFTKAFTTLKTTPHVVYPGVDLDALDSCDTSVSLLPPELKGKKFILSLNRYERKKSIDLAIDALGVVQKEKPSSDIVLVIAGGYDPNNTENIDHYEELKGKAELSRLSDDILFLRSIPFEMRNALLKHAICLVYTPSFEHFGIVPCEAMYLSTPVVCCASGGPLESVQHDVTGFHCNPDGQDFGEAILKLTENTETARRMGEAGRQRVKDLFSHTAFSEHLEEILVNSFE